MRAYKTTGTHITYKSKCVTYFHMAARGCNLLYYYYSIVRDAALQWVNRVRARRAVAADGGANGYTEMLPPSPLGGAHIILSSCSLFYNCLPRVYFVINIIVVTAYCVRLSGWVCNTEWVFIVRSQVCTGWMDGPSWPAEMPAISSLSRNYVDGSTLII